MRTEIFLLSGALAAFAATPAIADDKAAVMKVVNAYSEAFNKHDAKAFSAMCTNNIAIIDGFAPHVWQGASACSDWFAAEAADDKKNGDSNVQVTLHKPLDLVLSADRAYVVNPATLSLVEKGKAVKLGGEWTMTLQKTASGWMISGWAWAQH